MTVWDDLFTSLLFGAGNLIGLMIIVGITVVLLLKWKYSGIFMLIVTVLLAFEYASRAGETPIFVWHFTIMVFLSLFTAFYVMLGKEQK